MNIAQTNKQTFRPLSKHSANISLSLLVVQLTKVCQRSAGLLAAHLGNRKLASMLSVTTISQFSIIPLITFLAYVPSHPFHHSAVVTNSMEKCFQFLL